MIFIDMVEKGHTDLYAERGTEATSRRRKERSNVAVAMAGGGLQDVILLGFRVLQVRGGRFLSTQF